MVTAPISHARRSETGNQMSAATLTMTPSSDDEQPLNIDGSALSRLASMSSRRVMGVLDNARGFSQQVACENEDDGTDDTEHTDLGPFGFTLSRFVEFCEGEICNPQETEYGDGEAQYEATVLDVAFD